MPVSYLPSESLGDYEYQFSEPDYKVSEETVEEMRKMIMRWGYTIQDKKKEDYKVDIVAFKNDIPIRIEIEERIKGGNFGSREEFYPNVHFLARKKKYIREGHFIYFNISHKILSPHGGSPSRCIIMRYSKDIFIEGLQKVISCDSNSHKGVDSVYVYPNADCCFFNERTDLSVPLNSRFIFKNKIYKVDGLGIYKQKLNNQSVQMCYEIHEEGNPKIKGVRNIEYIKEMFDGNEIKII